MSSWFCVMMSSCCSPLKTHNVSLFCVYHCHIRNKLCVTCLLFVEAFDVETGPTWTFLHVLQRKKKHQKESSWIHHFCWPTNIFTRPGKHTKNYWKLPFIGWIFPLKMVIFHSYVKLPEGIQMNQHPRGFAICDLSCFLKTKHASLQGRN